MNRSRDNKSRFGPPNSYGSSSAVPIMNLKTGMSRNYEDSIFSTQNYGSSSSTNYKSPEQLAFDDEFKKWQKSFDDWKKVYANHPDRQAYREYERKFLDVREKLLEKRKQIYGEGNGGSSSGGFIAPFENQLFAADAMANSILSKFDEPKDFRDDDRYRGGYRRDDNFMDNRGSYGRGSFGDMRGNNRDGGRDRMRNDNRRDGGRFGNDRRDNNNRFGGNNRSTSRGNNNRFGNNRSMSGGDRRFGNDRNDRRSMQKPSQDQLQKDLNRRDIYPHNRWVLCSKEDRPPLVGKRAKKMNSKIQNVLERKRKIAAGEVPLEELPFSERIDRLFDMARVTELPKLLPGSAQRRVKNARKKKDEDLDADERKLLAYCDYVSVKRQKYFEEKKKLEAEEAKLNEGTNQTQTTTPMEQETSPA